MKKIVIILSCLILVACSNGQNNRERYVVERDGDKITCQAPPADIVEILNKNDASFKVKYKEVEKIAFDSNLSNEKKYEKIRNIDPQLQTSETIHYRLCVEYINGTYTKEEYKKKLNAISMFNSISKTIPIDDLASNSEESISKTTLPIKPIVAPFGVWTENDLGLTIKVKWIGGFCDSPCEPVIKAGLEVTTSTFKIYDQAVTEDFRTSFTQDNRTYKLVIEKIKTKPAYVVFNLSEIKN